MIGVVALLYCCDFGVVDFIAAIQALTLTLTLTLTQTLILILTVTLTLILTLYCVILA